MAKKKQQGAGLLILAGLLGLAMFAKPRTAGADEPLGTVDQGVGFGPFGGGAGAVGGRGAATGPPVIDPIPPATTFIMPASGLRPGEGAIITTVSPTAGIYGPFGGGIGAVGGRGAATGPPVIYPIPPATTFIMPGPGFRPGEGQYQGGGANGSLTRAHYEAVLASGDLSPNIRSYEQFLDSYSNSAALFFQEHPNITIDTSIPDPGETPGETPGDVNGDADGEADGEDITTDTEFVMPGGGRPGEGLYTAPAQVFGGGPGTRSGQGLYSATISADDQPAFMAEDETFYQSDDDDQDEIMAEDETFFEDPPDVQAEEEDIGGYVGGSIEVSAPQTDVFAGAYSAAGEDVRGDPSWYEPEPVYDYAGIEGDE